MHEALRSLLHDCHLTSKEADVYIAMLALGPASVQEIAEQSGVNRTTMYPMLTLLSQRGLIAMLEEGKKTVYVAEHPKRLATFVAQEAERMQRHAERVEECLPQLLALYTHGNPKPVVRFFEGEASLMQVREELFEPHGVIWEAYAVDEDALRLANVGAKERIEKTRHLSGRVLMAIKSGCVPAFFDRRGFEVREFPYERFPFAGDLCCIKDRVCILMHHPAMGILIESAEMSRVFRALFAQAWEHARPWEPPAHWGI